MHLTTKGDNMRMILSPKQLINKHEYAVWPRAMGGYYRARFNEEPWCGFFNPYTNKIKIMASDRDELWADLKCREIDIYEV